MLTYPLQIVCVAEKNYFWISLQTILQHIPFRWNLFPVAATQLKISVTYSSGRLEEIVIFH